MSTLSTAVYDGFEWSRKRKFWTRNCIKISLSHLNPIPYTIINVHGPQVRAPQCGWVITWNASFVKDATEFKQMLRRWEPELGDTVPLSPDVDGETMLLGPPVQLGPPHPCHPAGERKSPRHLADITAWTHASFPIPCCVLTTVQWRNSESVQLNGCFCIQFTLLLVRICYHFLKERNLVLSV